MKFRKNGRVNWEPRNQGADNLNHHRQLSIMCFPTLFSRIYKFFDRVTCKCNTCCPPPTWTHHYHWLSLYGQRFFVPWRVPHSLRCRQSRCQNWPRGKEVTIQRRSSLIWKYMVEFSFSSGWSCFISWRSEGLRSRSDDLVLVEAGHTLDTY